MRPVTTLYMLQSLDGKISTGAGDALDFDKDLAEIPMLKKGLKSYYSEEKVTDYWNILTAKTAVKLGANDGKYISSFHNCGHILVDSSCIKSEGIKHIANNCCELYYITTRPLDELKGLHLPGNVTVVRVHDTRAVEGWLGFLRDAYGIKHVTVECGGEFNASMLRAGLIDKVIVYIAPIIVGGRETPSLADGDSFTTVAELKSLCKMTLMDAKPYANFVRLSYKVLHE